MSFKNALVLRQNTENDGSLQAHNFQNKFISASELQKPS